LNRTLVPVTVIVAGLLAGACQEMEDFGECLMTQQMLSDCNAGLPGTTDQCSTEDAFCGPTCIVANHPECTSGPCLTIRYKDILADKTWVSTPFCGSSCLTDTDCPGEPGQAACKPMPGLKIECELDEDCQARADWSFCGTDKFCSWHVCVPINFAKANQE